MTAQLTMRDRAVGIAEAVTAAPPTNGRNIGDVDADGVPDVVTSAPSRNNNAGRVYVFSTASGKLLWTADGKPNDQLGLGVEGADDVNGDGIPDVIASAPGAGTAMVYSGRDGRVLLTLKGESGENFGRHVATAGDVDRDGHADVIVGRADLIVGRGSTPSLQSPAAARRFSPDATDMSSKRTHAASPATRLDSTPSGWATSTATARSTSHHVRIERHSRTSLRPHVHHLERRQARDQFEVESRPRMFILLAGGDGPLELMAGELRGGVGAPRLRGGAASLAADFVPEDRLDLQPIMNDDRVFVCHARLDEREDAGADSALLAQAYDKMGRAMRRSHHRRLRVRGVASTGTKSRRRRRSAR